MRHAHCHFNLHKTVKTKQNSRCLKFGGHPQRFLWCPRLDKEHYAYHSSVKVVLGLKVTTYDIDWRF